MKLVIIDNGLVCCGGKYSKTLEECMDCEYFVRRASGNTIECRRV